MQREMESGLDIKYLMHILVSEPVELLHLYGSMIWRQQNRNFRMFITSVFGQVHLSGRMAAALRIRTRAGKYVQYDGIYHQFSRMGLIVQAD